MGLWTCRIDDDSDAAGLAMLIDSVTMRPISLPLFRDYEQAEGFLEFARRLDVGDVRALGQDTLDRLHTAWVEAGMPAVAEADDEADDALGETVANDGEARQ